MSNNQAAYQQQFNLLKTAFLDSCQLRGQVIERAYKTLQQGSDSSACAELLQCLYDEAHKLAGASGSYGIKPLSDAAQQVELRCSALLASGAAPAVSDMASIDKLLQVIGEAGLNPVGCSPMR